MKKLSEQLFEMGKRAAAWETQAAARSEANKQEFEAEVAEARKSAQTAQAAMQDRLDSIQDSMASQWREVQKSFNNQVAAARSRAAERKAAMDLSAAQRAANLDEEYARVATEFAQWAAAEANAAMLGATQSRAYAKSLENETPASVPTR
jgi:hypothetical protein